MANVDLNESRQTEVLVVAWVMTGLAILTVGVKLFARVKIVQVVDWADFFIVFSLVRHCLVLALGMEPEGLMFADSEHYRIVVRSLWRYFGLRSPHSSSHS